ncbi:MAG TPA: hypothetical protein VKY73_19880 [Polyangiaceae bacterium]|nr:hypothetical protein [Polyangiaceae bacterium]
MPDQAFARRELSATAGGFARTVVKRRRGECDARRSLESPRFVSQVEGTGYGARLVDQESQGTRGHVCRGQLSPELVGQANLGRLDPIAPIAFIGKPLQIAGHLIGFVG